MIHLGVLVYVSYLLFYDCLYIFLVPFFVVNQCDYGFINPKIYACDVLFGIICFLIVFDYILYP